MTMTSQLGFTGPGYTFEIQVNFDNLTPAVWSVMGELETRSAADTFILSFWKKHGTDHVARIRVTDQDGNFAGWMS